MENLYTVVAVLISPLVLVYIWKILNFVWFKPKKLEKYLRQEGFNGNPYKFLFGDFTEMAIGSKEALSKPIDFGADFVPRIIPFIHKIVTRHGENSFIWLGPYASVVISNPDSIREILSKSYIFQKPYNPLGKMLAQGLASYDTDKWAKHRRLINPAFQLEKLKNMVPSFYLSCCDMLKKWDEIEPSDGTYEVDVWPYLQTLTGDAISRAAFDSSFEEGKKIFELQREQMMLLMKAILTGFIPGWRFLPTKLNRRMKKIQKDVDILVLGIIDKRMKAIEAGNTRNDSLLDILLESNLNEIQQNGSKSGISLQEVVEECKLFYTAGQETTSCLLVWTMILLAKHSDWQSRARNEVFAVFGSGQPDFQELNNLKIVTMILHEVLRLYPPGTLISRTVHKETQLGNVTLPTGVQILLPTILLQHDLNMWGEDAKEFNPARFNEGTSSATQDKLKYFPFSWGPRICIGQNFAMLEAKVAIAMVLKHYSFKLSPSYSHAPQAVATLQPQHGAHLILRKL